MSWYNEEMLDEESRKAKLIKACKARTGHVPQEKTFVRKLAGIDYICAYCKTCPVILPLKKGAGK